MAGPVVTTERQGGVVTVTLARPEARNALDRELKEALRAALAAVAADDTVRAVVLAGSGRAFCVGQDLREHAAALPEGPDAAFATVLAHYAPITLLLATMPKPVVAAVNGIAAGAGAAFALACDFRVVAESGGFNLAFAAIGLSCDSGSSWFLPRLVGVARAKELLMLGRTVPAEEARTLGLATEVVPDGELGVAAHALAACLAAGPTAAFAAIRRAIAFSATHPLEDSLRHEAALMELTGATEDHRAAVDAFLRKQQPVFRGR